MTEEQRTAFVFSQSTCALIEAMGMAAENKQREHRGESMAYDGGAFTALILKYGVHHNAVIATFED